jgi:hypothetical protein
MSLVSSIDALASRIATEFNTVRNSLIPYDGTTPPTLGQTVEFDGTNFVPADSSGGGVGGSLDFYKAQKNSTAQTVGATYTDLTGWVEMQSCQFGSFDVATGIFTFSADATCLVIPDVQATQISGNNRTQLQVRIMEDTGSGFAADATKEWFNYSHRNSTQNDGGVTPSYIESYVSGDQIKIQVLRVGTDVDVQESQARFSIVKLDGVQGPTGPTGPAGADGAAATIAVGTITTGAPGSSVIITNSGTANNAVFDFTIPRGDTGADGVDGATGPAGPAGADGADGQGVPTGGSTGQVLAKIDGTDFNTEWVDQSGGSPSYRGFAVELRGVHQIAASTWTLVPLALELHDTHGQFNNTNAQYKFTANQAGYYQINGQIVIENATDNSKILCAIYKNGSLHKLLGRGTVRAASSELAGFGGAAVVYMNGTTDYLQLYAWSNSTVTQYLSPGVGYTRMSGYYLGS